MWWAYKVNKSLAALGVDPASIPMRVRVDIQRVGKDAYWTPEETALATVAGYFGDSAKDTYPVIYTLICDKKIRTGISEIDAALSMIGYSNTNIAEMTRNLQQQLLYAPTYYSRDQKR